MPSANGGGGSPGSTASDRRVTALAQELDMVRKQLARAEEEARVRLLSMNDATAAAIARQNQNIMSHVDHTLQNWSDARVAALSAQLRVSGARLGSDISKHSTPWNECARRARLTTYCHLCRGHRRPKRRDLPPRPRTPRHRTGNGGHAAVTPGRLCLAPSPPGPGTAATAGQAAAITTPRPTAATALRTWISATRGPATVAGIAALHHAVGAAWRVGAVQVTEHATQVPRGGTQHPNAGHALAGATTRLLLHRQPLRSPGRPFVAL